MKKLILLIVPIALLLIACEGGGAVDPNTDRFYKNPWHGKLAIDSAMSSYVTMQTTVVFQKRGSLIIADSANVLGDYCKQNWSYSWATDELYVNGDKVDEWFINEDEDSLYFKYHILDFSSANGQEFNWTYAFYLSK